MLPLKIALSLYITSVASYCFYYSLKETAAPHLSDMVLNHIENALIFYKKNKNVPLLQCGSRPRLTLPQFFKALPQAVQSRVVLSVKNLIHLPAPLVLIHYAQPGGGPKKGEVMSMDM